jgi:hypothetical protein
MAYATKAQLKSYEGITETTDDTLLDFFLGVAQVSIDHACRQSFEASADTTRRFLSSSCDRGGAIDGRDLILDAPLCQVTTVTNGNGVVVAAGSYTTQPLNDTPWYALRLKQSSGLYWTYSTDVESDLISVVGRWAYSLTADAVIQQVTIRFASYLYRQKDTKLDLDRSIMLGSGAILPVKLPADIKQLLSDGGYMRTGLGG